jgi:hypothetical protein
MFSDDDIIGSPPTQLMNPITPIKKEEKPQPRGSTASYFFVTNIFASRAWPS